MKGDDKENVATTSADLESILQRVASYGIDITALDRNTLGSEGTGYDVARRDWSVKEAGKGSGTKTVYSTPGKSASHDNNDHRASAASSMSNSAQNSSVMQTACQPPATRPTDSINGTNGTNGAKTALEEESFDGLKALTDEILVFCHLLDTSRRLALDDCTQLRGTNIELERLIESARQREVSHLAYVDHQREVMNVFEKKYNSLRTKARGFLEEAQRELTDLKKKHHEVSTAHGLLETEVYTLRSRLDEQNRELERLHEVNKNLPSEKDLQKQRLRLLTLEDENGRLATDKSKLMDQLNQQHKQSGGSPKKASAAEHAEIQRLTRENDDLKKALTELIRQVAEMKKSRLPITV